MIILEFTSNQGEVAFINKEIEKYAEIDILEIDSLGLEPLVQVVIPVTAILAPVVSAIITKILESKKVTIKYKDIEITAGSYKEAKEIIDDIAKKLDK